jgi:hypothetical protein
MVAEVVAVAVGAAELVEVLAEGQAAVGPVPEALAVAEAEGLVLVGEVPVLVELEAEPLEVAEALAVVELVELAPLELVRVRELVLGQELEPAVEIALAVMLSKFLMLVLTDRLTPTGSARECFGFRRAIRPGLLKGATRFGLAVVGLAAPPIGSANTRPSLVAISGGTRRTCTSFNGLPTRSG